MVEVEGGAKGGIQHAVEFFGRGIFDFLPLAGTRAVNDHIGCAVFFLYFFCGLYDQLAIATITGSVFFVVCVKMATEWEQNIASRTSITIERVKGIF